MRHELFIIALAVTIVSCELSLVNIVNLSEAQDQSMVSGIISSDTHWTKANSPYTFTGPVDVQNGVTLTIEKGVQVDISAYYLQVDGSLAARGIDSDQVFFVGGEGSKIRFTPSSKSWDQITNSGSIIENGNFPSHGFIITIDGASPKIADCVGQVQLVVNSGSALIVKNYFYGGNPILVNGGAPIIFNNVIMGDGTCIEVAGGSPYIVNNNITNARIGISAVSGIIERNYINSRSIGVEIDNCIVRNNTIEGATDILVRSSNPTIEFNNFAFANVGGVSGIALGDGEKNDVIASYNWWGTVSVSAISESIHDFNEDFALGKVKFEPILTAPNPFAIPDPNAREPSSIPGTFPNVFLIIIVAISVVLAVAAVVYLKKRKHPS